MGFTSFICSSFLSCLCGSELLDVTPKAINVFLSCLCGSELKFKGENGGWNFLSCLCGSEHNYIQEKDL